MMAAHTNAVENLVVFAPLVLAAQALNIHTARRRSPARCFSGAGSPMWRSIPRAFRCCARCVRRRLVAQVMLVLAIFG